MKIVFDYQIFTLQKFGGISRYFSELIKELKSFPDVRTHLYSVFSNNEHIPCCGMRQIGFLKGYDFRGKTRIMNVLNKAYCILKLSSTRYDVFHPTYYDPYFLSYIDKRPFVLTIHDMIHEKFPQFFSAKDKTAIQKKILAEKCSKIIVPSNATKRDLLEILGLDESKIEVVYHGVSPQEEKATNMPRMPKSDWPEKYILYVGSRRGYKNFNRFIVATSYVLRQFKDILVLCIGGGKFARKEKEMMKSLGVADKVVHSQVTSDDLWNYYRSALMFVFPSLYEGFGLPILEAFVSGCPVVLSNIEPFREIAADAAYYFDPESEESIKSAISEVLQDEHMRTRLAEAGRKRVKAFSWKNTAMKTREVYEKVI